MTAMMLAPAVSSVIPRASRGQGNRTSVTGGRTSPSWRSSARRPGSPDRRSMAVTHDLAHSSDVADAVPVKTDEGGESHRTRHGRSMTLRRRLWSWRPPRARRPGPASAQGGDGQRARSRQLIRQLDNTEYVGEVGLDFSRHGRDTRDAQLRVLDRLLAQPALRHKVVTVHSRGAEGVTPGDAAAVQLVTTTMASCVSWW